MALKNLLELSGYWGVIGDLAMEHHYA